MTPQLLLSISAVKELHPYHVAHGGERYLFRSLFFLQLPFRKKRVSLRRWHGERIERVACRRCVPYAIDVQSFYGFYLGTTRLSCYLKVGKANFELYFNVRVPQRS